MNILLINPSTSNIYGKIGANLPPLGLGYIAAVARQGGHYIKIVDLAVDKEALNNLNINEFDLIGITATTPQYPEALKVAKKMKDKNKMVVMGGYHVTFMDYEALSTGVVDIVVRGEGEEIFLNLLNTLENKGKLDDVKGISYWEGTNYIRTDDVPPPQNLDELPFPARDLFPIDKYKNTLEGIRTINITTSRGCPFNCYFCSSSKFGGLKWRARSPESIADEIELLQKEYGFKAFAFMDDNFTLNPKRVIAFADEIEKRNIDIIWWCFSRVDTLVKNEFMVKRMAESGAIRIFLGLESANENVLDDYGKNITYKQQIDAVNLLRKYGIGIHGSFIIGDFEETEDMIMNTVKLAKKLKPEVSQFSVLTPFPGTALFEQVKRENKFLHNKWELYDALHPTIKLKNLTPKQLQKITVKSYRKAYLNYSNLFGGQNGKKLKFEEENKSSLYKTIKEGISLYFSLRSEILNSHL